MAKKKTESTDKSESKPKKPAAKKEVGKASRPSTGAPLVDTNLAAQAAARMLIARSKGDIASQGGSSIEQIKNDMNKSHGTTISGVLDKNAPLNKKPNLPTGLMNQRGHNQTFGADVNRAGVPRRTPG